MARTKATYKIKSVTFYRVAGRHVELRADPEYRHAIGRPDLTVIDPELLRYDRAFTLDSDPTLVAFPVFSSGYGSKTPTFSKWGSYSYRLLRIKAGTNLEEGETKADSENEFWNTFDLASLTEKIKNGSGDWYSAKHPRRPGGGVSYESMHRVTLSAFLKVPKDGRPDDASAKCPECRGYKTGLANTGEEFGCEECGNRFSVAELRS